MMLCWLCNGVGVPNVDVLWVVVLVVVAFVVAVVVEEAMLPCELPVKEWCNCCCCCCCCCSPDPNPPWFFQIMPCGEGDDEWCWAFPLLL